MTGFGRACARCKMYFVGAATDTICPWCRKIESGVEEPELYLRADDPEL